MIEEDNLENEELDDESSDNEILEEKILNEDIKPIKKLDYSLQKAEDRILFVKDIVNNTTKEQLTNKYIEILADYIIFAMDKEEKKEKMILTDNRMITVNKRETSYQGLVSKFENGEDGLYNLITNDKNVIMTPKVEITQKDIDDIEPLQKIKAAIEIIKEQEKVATGKKKFLLKKQLIEMCQDQYTIRSEYKPTMYCSNAIKNIMKADLSERIIIDPNGEPYSTGLVSLFNPKHISALLCNYSLLKEEAYGDFEHDGYYLMEDLDELVDRSLKNKYPLYYDLLIYKIDGKQNVEIQQLLERDYGISHSIEYISSLWRNKIPKIIAEQQKRDYLMWYYTTQEYGKWKKCTRCGEVKLAHNIFFSKNNTSKDGWYSICKECRNSKNK